MKQHTKPVLQTDAAVPVARLTRRARLADAPSTQATAAALAWQEHLIDEALMQTFPASDPIAPGFFN
jgi:hypothetical protein